MRLTNEAVLLLGFASVGDAPAVVQLDDERIVGGKAAQDVRIRPQRRAPPTHKHRRPCECGVPHSGSDRKASHVCRECQEGQCHHHRYRGPGATLSIIDLESSHRGRVSAVSLAAGGVSVASGYAANRAHRTVIMRWLRRFATSHQFIG
jgi:hypothetical protein